MSDFKLASRLDGVSESATLKLNAMVQSMRAQKIDVINLTAGEPDFNVPDEAKQAVIQAVNDNKSKYTPVAGIPELREAIAAKTNLQQPESHWKSAQVCVSNGGKQACFNAMMALLNPGDEVLIPSPYWLSYPEIVKICGAIPKFIHTPILRRFKITPAQLKASIGPRVKLLILNSPSNPTGVMYTREELQALGKVLLETPGAEKIWVMSDEIYDRIVFGGSEFCSFLKACPELKGRTITVNGMSKSAFMTGWRIGWSVAPDPLTQGIMTLQGQSTSGINAPAQWASVAALKMPESAFKGEVESFNRRCNLALEILAKTRKLEVVSPDGAFYFFLGIKCDSFAFAEKLLLEAKVAVVPGAPFGEPEFVRMSFALDEASLREGCHRIVKFLEA
jgi:aspartate aminotransferase